MTAERPVKISQGDGICWLTLNRPQARNALDDEMSELLVSTLVEIADDDAVRCLVMTGAGSAFCAGGDLNMMGDLRNALGAQDLPGAGIGAGIRRGIRRVSASLLLHAMPKPTIAMVNGHAVGGGLSLALACDFRVVAEDARLIVRFVKLGLSGDYGMTYFLPRLVGPAKARELLFLDDEITPAEGLRIGLVNEVVARETLRATTERLARRLAAGPPLAYARLKDNLLVSSTADLQTVLEREVINTRVTSLTADAREGALAIVERREPSFTGR
jgi:2-(1,2-epoxy-1,2-dihydrophenyl)acetyl-CoA isomerase